MGCLQCKDLGICSLAYTEPCPSGFRAADTPPCGCCPRLGLLTKTWRSSAGAPSARPRTCCGWSLRCVAAPQSRPQTLTLQLSCLHARLAAISAAFCTLLCIRDWPLKEQMLDAPVLPVHLTHLYLTASLYRPMAPNVKSHMRFQALGGSSIVRDLKGAIPPSTGRPGV